MRFIIPCCFPEYTYTENGNYACWLRKYKYIIFIYLGYIENMYNEPHDKQSQDNNNNNNYLQPEPEYVRYDQLHPVS